MKTLKDVAVDIILDLSCFDTEYGSNFEKEPNVLNVRPHIDATRTAVLRDVIGKMLFSGMHYERPESGLPEDRELYNDEYNYIKGFLREDITKSDFRESYYMRITKSSEIGKLYFLEIILNEGFITHLELDPSLHFRVFMQDILRTLFENEISDRDIVGYYLNLITDGPTYFKNSINNI